MNGTKFAELKRGSRDRRFCPFAEAGPEDAACPLYPDGPGLTVEMKYLDGEVKFFPFMKDVEVEHFLGLRAKLIDTNEHHSVMMFRLVADRAELGWHYHTESHETVVVLAGELEVWTGDKDGSDSVAEDLHKTLGPGDTIHIPAGKFHRASFKTAESGERCEIIVMWRPPMREAVNVEAPECAVCRTGEGDQDPKEAGPAPLPWRRRQEIQERPWHARGDPIPEGIRFFGSLVAAYFGLSLLLPLFGLMLGSCSTAPDIKEREADVHTRLAPDGRVIESSVGVSVKF